MINQIREYIDEHYPSKFSMACGVMCAVAAVEMAILVPYNISQISRAAGDVLEKYRYHLSANLGGALFYGLCALNIIPRTSAIGASIFFFYSINNFQKPDAYLTTRCIGETAKFITVEIIVPFCENVLVPICRKISEIVSPIVNFLAELILKIKLPKHPTWIGVGIMTAAIVIYKWVLPYFSPRAPSEVD